MTIAESIARWLGENEITHAFGIVGGGNCTLWDAIARHQKTRLISVHHEQAAAMAASYYYRTSGRLALCLVTTGAGSANAITGVLAAWMDSIPLIVISGNEPIRYINITKRPLPRVLGTQGYDSVEVARPFVKHAYRLNESSDVLHSLDLARTRALGASYDPPGPVWLDIPKDIQGRQCAASES